MTDMPGLPSIGDRGDRFLSSLLRTIKYIIDVRILGVDGPSNKVVTHGELVGYGLISDRDMAAGSRIVSTFTGIEVETVETTTAFYLGASGDEGSWRVTRAGEDLCFSRREQSIWVEKFRITGT